MHCRQSGTIIVEEQTNAIPDGALDFFGFVGIPCGSVSLSDGQQTSCTVIPGSYNVSEIDTGSSFRLTDISCDDGASANSSTGDPGNLTATFNIAPGETVKCTFYNSDQPF